jgi:hypothetical protein
MDWYRREFNRHLAYATQNQHEAYMNIATRAIEVGYYRAMTLWLLDDRVWSKEIEDFASWSIEYDLWSKLRLFGDQINIQFQQEMAAYNGDRNSSRSDELKSLPDVFTYEQVVNVRIMLGKPVDNHRMIQNQIDQWVSRKKVIRNINTGKYEKNKQNKHNPLTTSPSLADWLCFTTQAEDTKPRLELFVKNWNLPVAFLTPSKPLATGRTKGSSHRGRCR